MPYITCIASVAVFKVTWFGLPIVAAAFNVRRELAKWAGALGTDSRVSTHLAGSPQFAASAAAQAGSPSGDSSHAVPTLAAGNGADGCFNHLLRAMPKSDCWSGPGI